MSSGLTYHRKIKASFEDITAKTFSTALKAASRVIKLAISRSGTINIFISLFFSNLYYIGKFKLLSIPISSQPGSRNGPKSFLAFANTLNSGQSKIAPIIHEYPYDKSISDTLIFVINMMAT